MLQERRRALQHLAASVAGAAAGALPKNAYAATCSGVPTNVSFVTTSIGSGGPGTWTGALGTTPGVSEGEAVIAIGAVTSSDRAGGLFVWTCSIGSAADDYDDGGLFIKPTTVPSAEPGRWVRVYSGPVDVRWFGARGNGVTNDGATIARALTRLYGSIPGAVGGVLRFSRGTYLVTTSITLPRHHAMSVIGDGAMASAIRLSGAAAATPLLRFNTAYGTTYPPVENFHLSGLRIQRTNRGYLFVHEAALTSAGYTHTRLRRAFLNDLVFEETPTPATPTTFQPLVYLQNADACTIRHATFRGGSAGFLRIENGNGCLLSDLQATHVGTSGDAGAGLLLVRRSLTGMPTPVTGDHEVVRVRVEPLSATLPSPRDGVLLDGVRNCQLASVSVDGTNTDSGIRATTNTTDTTLLNTRAATTTPTNSAGVRLDGLGAHVLGLRYPDPAASGAQGLVGTGRGTKVSGARHEAGAALAASNASFTGVDYRMTMADSSGNLLGKRSSFSFAVSGSTVVYLSGREEVAVTTSGSGPHVITNVHQGWAAGDVAAPYEGQRVTLFIQAPVTVQHNANIALRDGLDASFLIGEVLELTSDGVGWVESGRHELP